MPTVHGHDHLGKFMADPIWYYGKSGQQHGPVSQAELRSLLTTGQLLRTDLVWREGMAEWSPASSVPELLPAPIPAVQPAPAVPSPSLTPPVTPPLGYYKAPPITSPYAGFWPRVAAAILDGIIIGTAGCVILMPVMTMGMMVVGPGRPGRMPIAAQSPSQLFGMITGWLYAALMESSSTQATLGKMALGIRMTDMEGRRISFGRATGRHFAKYLSLFFLFIGYIMVAFTERKQGLHDIMAGTLVVQK